MANRAVGLMPKKEFIKRVADELEVTQNVANLIIETIESVIIEGLHDYNKVKFADLATFTKQEVPERVYRLPGEEKERVCEAHTKILADMVDGSRRLPKKTEENE